MPALKKICEIDLILTLRHVVRLGDMKRDGLKVGDLARRAGLSIRTLHYYDEIGLLSPAMRTDSGHRLYTRADIERLQKIRSLQQIGFSLEQVRDALHRRDFSLRRVLDTHLERLREQSALQQRLIGRIEALLKTVETGRTASVDELLESLELMTMCEKYYTPEQMEQIKAQGAKFGDKRIREVQAEWPKLIADVKAAMAAGTEPSDPAVVALAKRWMELVAEFTGGNPGVEKGLQQMYQSEPTAGERFGLGREVFEYIGKAMKIVRDPRPS